jgi:RNA polymerase sigma-70 factor (ECF subfamily)
MEQMLFTVTKDDYPQIYVMYFPKLVRFSEAYVSRQDAENIVQDIFLYLWEHWEIMEELKNMNAFLFILAKNRCIDLLRCQAKDRHQSIMDLREKELQLKLYALQNFDENCLTEDDIEAIITNAVNSLPEKCREIFVLSRFEGLRHKEIAARLCISTNTIEGQINIALKKLRKELKDYIPIYIFMC